MNRMFTALVVMEAIATAFVTLSWLYSGTMTPWGVLVYVLASFVIGACFGVAFERRGVGR